MSHWPVVTLRPSQRWRALSWAAHGFALLSLWLATVPAALAVALATGIVGHALWIDRDIARTHLALRADGTLANSSGGGTALAATADALIAADSRLWGPFVLLCVQRGARQRWLVLLSDSAGSPGEWAALRRAIRWRGRVGETSTAG